MNVHQNRASIGAIGQRTGEKQQKNLRPGQADLHQRQLRRRGFEIDDRQRRDHHELQAHIGEPTGEAPEIGVKRIDQPLCCR
jgi:hypothetical protein